VAVLDRERARHQPNPAEGRGARRAVRHDQAEGPGLLGGVRFDDQDLSLTTSTRNLTTGTGFD
jgi:hypothetical protein